MGFVEHSLENSRHLFKLGAVDIGEMDNRTVDAPGHPPDQISDALEIRDELHAGQKFAGSSREKLSKKKNSTSMNTGRPRA